MSEKNDLQLAAAISRALESTGYPLLRAVSVSVDDGVVTLSGCVPTYYLKQVAQTRALGIKGIEGLRNELEISSIEQEYCLGLDS